MTSFGTHAEYVSQVFLGVRLQCANCHNHPLDRWTQDDYHGLAAVFAKLEPGPFDRAASPGRGDSSRTGKSALPRIPGLPLLTGTATRRGFHRLVDSPRQSLFASRLPSIASGRELHGRGLVEPIDDHRSTNPATHPELLAGPGQGLCQERFSDIRYTLRVILASEATSEALLTTANNKVTTLSILTSPAATAARGAGDGVCE